MQEQLLLLFVIDFKNWLYASPPSAYICTFVNQCLLLAALVLYCTTYNLHVWRGIPWNQIVPFGWWIFRCARKVRQYLYLLDQLFLLFQKNSLDLYISHQRGPFFKAEFQTELDLNKFHIADVTDKRIFVSVMHTENLANLYVSEISRNFTQYNFVLSLEQVLCYFPDGNWKDSWLE